MFLDDVSAIVCQIGSLRSMIGHVGDEAPFYSFASFYRETEGGDKYSGEDLLSSLSPTDEIKPLVQERSIISAEETTSLIVNKVFKFGIDPKDYAFLMCLNDFRSEAEERSKLLECLFEKHNAPASFVIGKQVCSIFATGRQSGICVDVGANTSDILPIHEGYSLRKNYCQVDFGGEYFTNKIKELMGDFPLLHYCQLNRNQKSDLNSLNDITPLTQLHDKYTDSAYNYCSTIVARKVKEKVFMELKKGETSISKSIELPDRRTVSIDLEDPLSEFFIRGGNCGQGLHIHINDILNKVDIDVRKSVGSAVVLTGGGSLINGFSEILEQKLGFVGAQQTKIRVISSSKTIERKLAGWIGASIMGSTGAFQNMWISQQEYEESGSRIILQKCLN